MGSCFSLIPLFSESRRRNCNQFCSHRVVYNRLQLNLPEKRAARLSEHQGSLTHIGLLFEGHLKISE